MRIILLALILLPTLAQAREIGNIYDPSTGQTTYINQDRNGFNAYDPSTGKTVYYQAN